MEYKLLLVNCGFYGIVTGIPLVERAFLGAHRQSSKGNAPRGGLCFLSNERRMMHGDTRGISLSGLPRSPPSSSRPPFRSAIQHQCDSTFESGLSSQDRAIQK